MEKNSTIKKVAVVSVVVIGVFAVLLLLQCFIPIYPSPEHDVGSYEELMNEIDGLCVLPEKNVFNNDESKYTVYLESRFSNKAIGYMISFPAADEAAYSISVECKATNELPDESKKIIPTTFCDGVELEVDKNHICFILNDFRYDIHGINSDDSFEQAALSIVQNMIDIYNRG